MGLGLLAAAAIGLVLGVLGGGGSILTVPVFVYLLDFDPKPAIAMSLAVVGATSLFGALGHWRTGNVNLRVAAIFGVVAMVGTYLGARLAVLFSGAAQLALFGAVMLLAAYFMFRGRRPTEAAGRAKERMPLAPIAVVGIGVGVLTGLVGVGGGFLIVPALVLLAGVPMKEAVGTSLLVIALNTASGFFGYLGRVEVDWAFMGLFTAVAVAGITAGTWLVRYLPQTVLRRAFAVFLVIMGSFILYQNRAVFLPDAGGEGAGAEVDAAVVGS
ncbi:MAG: sulfite exporter TauE/SafE family protein [Gemmatimonadota bacterium]|jgi:uncharacterized membrane protein YfcA